MCCAPVFHPFRQTGICPTKNLLNFLVQKQQKKKMKEIKKKQNE